MLFLGALGAITIYSSPSGGACDRYSKFETLQSNFKTETVRYVLGYVLVIAVVALVSIQLASNVLECH